MTVRGIRYIRSVGAAALLMLAGQAYADLDGRWTGALATPNGNMNVAFDFVEDGGMVTGTSTGPDGAAVAISDGKLEGDKLSFNISVDMGGTPATFPHTGTVKGDTIDMSIDAFGMPMTFSVTRAAQ